MTNFLTPEWVNAGAMSLTAIATFAGAGAVIWGVITTRKRLNESLETRRETKRAEVAENLIVLAHKTRYAIYSMRSPLNYIKPEKNRTPPYLYENYHKSLEEHTKLIIDFHEAQIYVKAVIGYEDVDKAVVALMFIMDEILSAVNRLTMYEQGSIAKIESTEIDELLQTMYNINPEIDVIPKKIDDAVKIIETRLAPIARIEKETSKKK